LEDSACIHLRVLTVIANLHQVVLVADLVDDLARLQIEVVQLLREFVLKKQVLIVVVQQ